MPRRASINSKIVQNYNLRQRHNRAAWARTAEKLTWDKPIIDPNRYPITLRIEGNHEDPHGNAVPYYRMTQSSKYFDPQAKRYLAWQEFVRQQWQIQIGKPLPSERNGFYGLDVTCMFIRSAEGRCAHADPENVRKGIQDALFGCGDQHVYGSVDIVHAKHPCVIVKIYR